MKVTEFISNRAAFVEKVVPPVLCEQTIECIEKEFDFKPCKYNSEIALKYRDSSEVKIEDKKLSMLFWKHIKQYI